jgi:TonB-dependent SusC/RagA subfamily outer membrane receptor
LLECGFLNDEKDREFISKEKNQTAIAQKILLAIGRYAANDQSTQKTINDTVPKVQVKEVVLKNPSSSTGAETKKSDIKRNWKDNPPLFIVDGEEMSKEDIDKIDPATIESIDVLKGTSATDKYGEKGANGVVEIKSKPSKTNLIITDVTLEKTGIDTIPKNQPIFTKVEIEAAIDKDEWRQFLQKNLQPVIEQAASKGMKPGTYTVNVKFIVKKDGSIINIKALNDPGYELAQKTVSFMKDSPKWKPGLQNGKPVNSYHTQPVTFVIQEQ